MPYKKEVQALVVLIQILDSKDSIKPNQIKDAMFLFVHQQDNLFML